MTSLTILKENLTWETFSVELSRARAIGNKFGYLCMGAIPFDQNVWFQFSATSSTEWNFAPECLKFLVEWFAFRKSFRSLGPFPGKYFTNCRCFQSFLSFGWMESAQNASKKFWFWENRLHVLLTMCKSMCCTCKLDVQTLALLITSG